MQQVSANKGSVAGRGAPECLITLEELAVGPHLRGLARAAAEAPEVDTRNDVTYSALACKSILSRCDSPRVPFRWTINPYRGCEFGCVYCYARYTHEYLEMQDWRDFERRIYIKESAGELLAREIRTRYRDGKWIAIGAATDPYQPAERRHRVTRSMLTVLSKYEGIRLSITTKSDLVLRDLDLIKEIDRKSEIAVNLTITTVRADLARILEPRAPRPDLRLGAVAALRQARIHSGTLLMPILPGINDSPLDLEALAREVAATGASYLSANILFLRASSRKRFMPFIREHFPHLARYYGDLYARDSRLLDEYSEKTLAKVDELKEKYGLNDRLRYPVNGQKKAVQQSLDL